MEPPLNVDCISFPDKGWKAVTREWDRKIFESPEGDQLTVIFFDHPLALPQNCKSTDELRQFVLKEMNRDAPVLHRILSPIFSRSYEWPLVTLEIIEIDQIQALYLITKEKQVPSGITFYGQCLIPFEHFYYEINMQCIEAEITGTRETALALKAIPDLNFYDTKYDSMFPDHPISRLRAKFPNILESTHLNEQLKNSKPFILLFE